jgi:hypothetical protein
MRRKELKKIVLSMLENEQWPAIASGLSQFEEIEIINHLFSALCHTNEKCKWHAVSSFGIVVPRLAKRDPESARIVMRRFLWSLNDESGGIGWGIPEAMGEVMALDDALFDEYVHMLISYVREDGPEAFQDGNFLELPALQRGVLWGIARLLSLRRTAMISKGVAGDFHKYLNSSDQVVQGLAAWCLGMCGDRQNIEDLRMMVANRAAGATFSFYWEYDLKEVSVSALAEQAIARIETPRQ